MDQLWAKKKKNVAHEELIKKAKNIFSDFIDFTSGVRTLFLIQRHKEGGETHNSRLKKVITRNSKEFYNALEELVIEQGNSEFMLRVYSCVNDRDFNKAIHKFKVEQLDADLYHQEQKENFYLDVKNRFLGCLMQPSQANDSLFLWDCDDAERVDVVGVMLRTIPNELIVKQYRTKNGWHIITKPFNHTIYNYPTCVELKKDGLLLLSY